MASPAQAQQDTTRAPADTVRADTVAAPVDTTRRNTIRRDSLRADSLGARRQRRRELSEAQAVELDVPRPGRALGRRPPVRDPALAASDLVARAPGTFHHDVGAVGWPHGVSFRGRPPDWPVLTLDGMPFDDPVTGRPRYDLLPMPFMRALRVQTGAAARSAPASVHAALRPYDEGRPLTELRYRTSGFQSVGALHTQQRKVRFFGRPAFTQFTGGYFGRGADNAGFLDGKGVELRTERRLLGRLRYRRRRWAVQLTALHNRRYRGAAGGVALEPDRPLESAFFRPRPIRFPDARRRLLRTDLSATLRWETPLGERVAAAAPLTVSAYWTGQTQRYRNPALTDTTRPAADTVAADTDRYGLRLRQRLTVRSPRLGGHDLTLDAHAWTDRFSGGNALPEGATRTRLHLSARDSTRLFGNAATLSAGLHAGSGQTYPSASARLARALDADTSRRAALRVFAEASLAGQPLSWAAQEGFGPLVRPLPEGRTPGRVLSAGPRCSAVPRTAPGRRSALAGAPAPSAASTSPPPPRGCSTNATLRPPWPSPCRDSTGAPASARATPSSLPTSTWTPTPKAASGRRWSAARSTAPPAASSSPALPTGAHATPPACSTYTRRRRSAPQRSFSPTNTPSAARRCSPAC
ncbi:MAG: hypothetical protein BRD46_02530 [Bacteroidetes bacterium QS_8_68_15]|nr:MAG: hypothetical protein BRD46_02530 [Bacteroidetes bacterium QS_8_68_15]